MSTYRPLTGKVTSNADGTGQNIVGPKHGTTGYWTPSDQATHPILPHPVVWVGHYGWVSKWSILAGP